MDIGVIIKNMLGIDPAELMATVTGFQQFIISRDRWAQDQAALTRQAHDDIIKSLIGLRIEHSATLDMISEIHSIIVSGMAPAGKASCQPDPSIAPHPEPDNDRRLPCRRI